MRWLLPILPPGNPFVLTTLSNRTMAGRRLSAFRWGAARDIVRGSPRPPSLVQPPAEVNFADFGLHHPTGIAAGVGHAGILHEETGRTLLRLVGDNTFGQLGECAQAQAKCLWAQRALDFWALMLPRRNGWRPAPWWN